MAQNFDIAQMWLACTNLKISGYQTPNSNSQQFFFDVVTLEAFLHSQFKLKDLGTLKFFLGLELLGQQLEFHSVRGNT